MSRYTRDYWSASKHRRYMIEELNDFQLVNGTRKLAKQVHDGTTEPPEDDGLPNDSEVLAAMIRECGSRGLDPRWKNGLAPGDERLNGAEAVELGPLGG